jgi:hypothetical protein
VGSARRGPGRSGRAGVGAGRGRRGAGRGRRGAGRGRRGAGRGRSGRGGAPRPLSRSASQEPLPGVAVGFCVTCATQAFRRQGQDWGAGEKPAQCKRSRSRWVSGCRAVRLCSARSGRCGRAWLWQPRPQVGGTVTATPIGPATGAPPQVPGLSQAPATTVPAARVPVINRIRDMPEATPIFWRAHLWRAYPPVPPCRRAPVPVPARASLRVSKIGHNGACRHLQIPVLCGPTGTRGGRRSPRLGQGSPGAVGVALPPAWPRSAQALRLRAVVLLR